MDMDRCYLGFNWEQPSLPWVIETSSSCLILVAHAGKVLGPQDLHLGSLSQPNCLPPSGHNSVSQPDCLPPSDHDSLSQPYCLPPSDHEAQGLASGDNIPTEAEPPRLHRSQMVVYALVRHDIENYDRFCGFLAEKEITVLKEPVFDASLTDAINTDRVELFEVIVGDTPNSGKQLLTNAKSAELYILELILGDIYKFPNELFDDYQGYMTNRPEDWFDEENLDLLKELTKVGTEMRFLREFGGTLLHYAAVKKSVALARALLDSGADITAVDRHGRTALHCTFAAYNHYGLPNSQYFDFIDLLLQFGANINETGPMPEESGKGATPLCIALQSRSPDLKLIEYLLKLGVDVNVDSKEGNVLSWAVSSGPEFLTRILAHGLDLNCEKNQEVFRDCFKYRKYYPNYKDALWMLEEYGFRIRPRDAQNSKLLLYAKESADMHLLNVLFKWGAEVHYRANAILEGEEENVVKKLLTAFYPDFACAKFLLVLDDARSGIIDDVFDSYQYQILSVVFNEVSLLHLSSMYYAFYAEKDALEKIAWKVIVLDLSREDLFFLNREKLANRVWFPYQAFESTPPEEYFLQVADMKEQKIGDSMFSFYDLLDSPEQEIVNLLKNPIVAAELKAGHYKERFPDFEGVIEWRLLRANYRRSLLDKGMIMLSYLFRNAPELPDDISEKILDCLTNLDLLVFVNIGKWDADVRVATRDDSAQDLANILEDI